MKFQVHCGAPFAVIIKSILIYAAPSLISWKLSEYAGLMPFILRILFCSTLALYIVCAVHEMFHALFFWLAGAKIVAVKIGVLELSFRGKSPQMMNAGGAFTGFCKVSIPDNSDSLKIALAFAAGGLSGILIAILSMFLMALLGVTPFLFDVLAASLAGGLTALLFPCCQDHKYIIKYMGRARRE